jgi:hypothetical protein
MTDAFEDFFPTARLRNLRVVANMATISLLRRRKSQNDLRFDWNHSRMRNLNDRACRAINRRLGRIEALSLGIGRDQAASPRLQRPVRG